MSKGNRPTSENDALEQHHNDSDKKVLWRIWHWLNSLGAMTYEDVPSRRQTRLLSSLLSFLVPLSFVATVVSLVTVPDARFWRDPDLLLVAAGLVLLTTAYGLNRAGHYKWAAFLTLSTSSISIFVTAVPQTYTDDTGLLLYLVVPALICSMLLPLGAAAILSAVQIVGMLLFAILVPMVTMADIIDYTAYVLIVSGLVLVSAYHRNQLERDRQAELEQSSERYRQYAARLETLRDVDVAILAAHSSSAIFASALQHIQSLIPIRRTQVLEIYPTSGEAVVLAARGDVAAAPTAGTRLSLDPTLLLAELERGGTCIVDDALDLPPSSPTRQRLLSAGARCMVAVSLTAQGQLIGALEVQAERPGVFGPNHIEIVREVADTLAVAIQQARLHERVQRYAEELEQRVVERTSELSAANAELARTSRLKDEFLASMSHELRTPLNAVLGLSEALRSEVYGPLNERQAQSLGTIHQSGNHLLELINEVLDVARIGAGKVELDVEDIQVQPLCRASLDLVKPMAQRKALRVSLTLDGAVTTVQADRLRLKQILVNLLSNAVKFTPDGGSIGLETEGDAAAQVVRFSIWDTGIGISEEGLRHLFQPFVQLDGGLARRYEGTGLGLVLAYRMTELHGGSLAVESKEGVGSRFTVSLPWIESVQSEPHSGVTVENKPPDAPHIEGKPGSSLVLLAEDNENTISVVSSYLQAHGYRVIVARDGAEAVARTEEFAPRVILMDIQMPGMDGLEATRRIRALPEIAGTPIIAVTALSMPGDRERCLEAGIDAYLSKPVRMRRLLEAIEEAVR